MPSAAKTPLSYYILHCMFLKYCRLRICSLSFRQFLKLSSFKILKPFYILYKLYRLGFIHHFHSKRSHIHQFLASWTFWSCDEGKTDSRSTHPKLCNEGGGWCFLGWKRVGFGILIYLFKTDYNFFLVDFQYSLFKVTNAFISPFLIMQSRYIEKWMHEDIIIIFSHFHV